MLRLTQRRSTLLQNSLIKTNYWLVVETCVEKYLE